MQPLDFTLLETVYLHLHLKGVHYFLGSKVLNLTSDTSEVNRLDCSGFVQYAVAKASHQRLILPEGSVGQHERCKEQGLESVNYRAYGSHPLQLMLAFINPIPGVHPGHVWFVHNGQTMECSPSTGGVGERPWNARVLFEEVAACFVLPILEQE